MNRPLAAQRGLTLVELVITITVMGILIATVIPLFVTTQRGYTAMEVGTVLPAATQEALNKIQHRLVENKRLFDSTSTSFTARLPTLSPTPMTSQLPTVAPNMGLSPSSSSFVSANMGNSLFFASLYSPKDYTVVNGASASVPVRIDTAMFNYYYVAPNASVTLMGTSQKVLREWHSVPYADYQQLMDIPDVTKRSNAVKALFADGILYSFDVSASTGSSAFYTLSSGGAIAAAATHTIVPATDLNKPKEMIDLIEGVASGGFRYGVSPNTGGSFTHSKTVPLYATANSSTGYPTGFEVAIVGTGSARQVFVRLVMAAQGNFKGYKGFENILLVTARDLY